MNRIFIDANIPMYAAEAPHPLKKPSQRVILAVADGELDAVTDAEVLQEILYRCLHIGEREKGFLVFDNFERIMAGRILPIQDVDVQKARRLAEQYSSLGPRDLFHLAVMVNHQLTEIVTADTGFDAVPEVTRIDPNTFV